MTRYAIYAIPGAEPGAPGEAVALRDAVEAWYCANPGITVDPRRYGFHATLKAPFRLAEGRSARDLSEAVGEFAAGRDPLALPDIAAVAIGRFRALAPRGDASELNALAADVVREFEPFRAPLTALDIARRRPERLSPRQRELLTAFGYPYVLDEFRLHLTLTDALEDPGDVDRRIADHFAAFAGCDIPLTSLAISVEPAPGEPFRILQAHPFASKDSTA